MNKTDTMKRISTILTALLLIVVFSTAVTAQSSDQATVTATANVAADLTVESLFNLDFKNILLGTTKMLDASNQSVNSIITGTETTGGVTGNEVFGVVQIDYVPQETINIEIDFPNYLSGVSNSSNTLTASFVKDGFSGVQGSTSSANAILVDGSSDPGNSQPLSGGSTSDWVYGTGIIYSITDFEVPQSGTIYVVIGGEVKSLESTLIQQYQADIAVEVTIPD